MTIHCQEGDVKRISVTCFLILTFMASGQILLSQTAQERIAQGDGYYSQFNDAMALEEYLAALQFEPENFEALWKVSRAMIDVADGMSGTDKATKDKQQKLYMDAERHARRAVAINAEDSQSYFLISSAVGKKVLQQGKKEQINASKEVKKVIEKAIELDPNNDLAYHALGRWHRRMAEIGGVSRFMGGIIYGSIPKGSFEESETALKKAIEIKPDYGNHHLELGRTYLALKKTDLAAEEFQKCIDAPILTSKCEAYRNEAEAELAKLKKG